MSQSPSISGQTSLVPVNACVLIKLDRTDKKEGKYDTRTKGIVIAIPNLEEPTKVNSHGTVFVSDLLSKRVYFEEYKEGARIKRDGELFCFIKIEDIRGFEEIND